MRFPTSRTLCAASVYACEFSDGATHVGCCPTCVLHGARCTCPAEVMLLLHRKMPALNELTRRLHLDVGYSLSIVSEPVNLPDKSLANGGKWSPKLLRLVDAVIQSHVDAYKELGREVIVRPRKATRTFSADHRQKLSDCRRRRSTPGEKGEPGE